MATDKALDLNPNLFHLMNTSSQRISLKSLDMQRQTFQKQNNSIQMNNLSTF